VTYSPVVTPLPATGPIYDCVGIGFGPSNIALAIALEEQGLLDNCLFLESQDGPSWHPGMMLPGTDIQHNPLRDLVTPRNPRSPYGFLSYLQANDRLYDFLNLDAPFPPRCDYAGYVTWVAEQFSAVVRYGQRVSAIEMASHDHAGLCYRVSCGDQQVLARSVSFGPGRSPLIPAEFQPHMGERMVHLNDYLPAIERWLAAGDVKRIAIIGGSQSAAEMILHITDQSPDVEVVALCRRFGFKLKDLSPFTERIYMPEFVDYFYDAGEDKQAEIVEELWRSNYGAADHDVIAALNMRMYEQKVTGKQTISLKFNAMLKALTAHAARGFDFALQDRYSGEQTALHAAAVILATGYRNFGDRDGQELFHPLMASLFPLVALRKDGSAAVERDFRMRFAATIGDDAPPFFLNGVCESTHGFGDAGSFSLLSVRSALMTQTIQQRCCSPSAPASPKRETEALKELVEFHI
jgi:L-ornithine N5-oxygenase